MEGEEGLPIDKLYPTVVLDALAPNNLKKTNEVEDDILSLKNEETTLRKKYRIDIAGKNFQRSCIFAACSFPVKVYIVLLMIFCQRQKAGYVVGKEVLSKMGVNQLVKEFTIHCQPEIKRALMVFTEPDNYPIEIHCTQGKDRTGMISALILSIAGVPEEIIVSDYAKTQKGLSPIYQQMLEDVRRVGLTDDFVKSPPEVHIYIHQG
ncbi:protein-tyrosine phosphatase-like protein [Sporodiniella umbellata]|nr:protein-tyrosine phosphatase-like protein [Sporodiniella umbellata]